MPGKMKPRPSVRALRRLRDRRIKEERGSDRQCSGGKVMARMRAGWSMTYASAGELGLSGYSGKNKSELVSMLTNH